MQPIGPCGRYDFQYDERLGTTCSSIKQNVARGSVSWGSEDNDAAGELQLWCHERDHDYCLYASNTEGDRMVVCKIIDVFTLSLPKVH